MNLNLESRIVYAKGLAGRLKAVAAAAIPVVTVIESAVTDNNITPDEWKAIGVAVVGAVVVYFTPNKGANMPAIVTPIVTRYTQTGGAGGTVSVDIKPDVTTSTTAVPLITPETPGGPQPLDEPPAPPAA